MIDHYKALRLKEDVIVFPLSSCKRLTKDVCDILGIEPGKAKVDHFADGEIIIELEEPVRGKDVYFIQSTSKPVNDRLMELLIAIDACKRASAASINILIPYYGYARQDRKAKPRQPISSRLVASILEAAGATRVMTMDLHAKQIQGFFDIPADDLVTQVLFAKYFKEHPDLQGKDLVVVSPDHGGTVRARALADSIGTGVAIIDKRRPKPNIAIAMELLGDVKGKVAIIVDDMVDTAGTLQSGIGMLYDKGATDVYACAAHALLSDPAIKRLEETELREFITTDTIDQEEHAKLLKKMRVLSVAPLCAAYIEAIQFNQSLSGTLSEYEAVIDPSKLEVKYEETIEE